MKRIDIKQLIPQRAPILMVDELLKAEEYEGICQLVIQQDNRFLEADGSLSATGLVEHIAQSASALCGYHALERGERQPPKAYIGEVKHFHCYRQPYVGEILQTHIKLYTQVGHVTLLEGTVEVEGERIAETQLKIGFHET